MIESNVLRDRLDQLLPQVRRKLEHAPLEAAAPAREAEHLARRLGDNFSWAQSLFGWGVSALCAGETPEAITLLSRALATYRFLGDEEGQWAALTAIAQAWRKLGDTAQYAETQALADANPNRELFEIGAAWLRWVK